MRGIGCRSKCFLHFRILNSFREDTEAFHRNPVGWCSRGESEKWGLKSFNNWQGLFYVNLRPGGGHFDHPKWFFGSSGKTAVFAYLLIHQFRTLPENVCPRSSQVRSPGQVKWPHLKKYLGFRRGYSFWCINLKLSGVHKGISTHKTYISGYLISVTWGQFNSEISPT